MPTIAIELNDVDAAIIRPVASGIIEDVKRITGIDQKCKTIFIGALGRAAQPGSTIGDDSNTDLTSSDMLIQFDLEEDPLDETALTNGVYNRNHHFVFLDPVLGINIKPVYTQTEFTLNIKGRFPDKNSAVKWRNEFRRFTMSGRRTNTHVITYHYPLPLESIIILSELHRLRERKAPYNETFETYIRNHIGDKITTLADQAGNNQTVAVAESQVNVVGWFDGTTAQPEVAQPDKEKSTYEVTFVYKYRFDKPISVVMQYPLMVHNQILSKKFRSDETPYSLEKEAMHGSLVQQAQDIFRSNYPGIKKGYSGISYPYYDDWLPEYKRPFNVDMIRFMIRVSQTDLRAVVDLHDLDIFTLDPMLLEYLSTRPSGAVRDFGAAVHFRLYCGQDLMEEPCLVMSDQLVIRSTVDLDIRKQYHLVMTLLPDLTVLSNEAQEHLREYGELVITLAKILYPESTVRNNTTTVLPNMNNNPPDPFPDSQLVTIPHSNIGVPLANIPLLSNGGISKVNFNVLINAIKDHYSNYTGGPDTYNKTVAEYTIVAHRRT